MTRRGVAPALLPALLKTLAPPTASAGAAAMRVWTAKAALAALAGQPGAGGFVSATAWALARAAARRSPIAPLAAATAAAAVVALALAPAGSRSETPPSDVPAAVAAVPRTADFASLPEPAELGVPSARAAFFPVAASPRTAPPPVAVEPPGGVRRSDLVAHWPLDGPGQDGWIEDRSGRGHRGRIFGPVLWTAGKIGRALLLDGRGSYIEPAVSPDLERVHRSSFSLTAWFRPEDIPPGRGSEARASYGILLRTGWHTGLLFDHEGRFLMTDWLRGDTEPLWNTAGTWEITYAPGHWYHLVGVVDRGLGRVSLYVNGVLRHTQPFDPSREVFEIPEGRWRIGIGNPNWKEWSWPARGAIDDVRIYNRPLSPTDVRLIMTETAEHDAGDGPP